MKIGMILDGTFPPDPRVENEAAALIGEGHEVFLFCLDYAHNQKVSENREGIRIRRIQLPKHLYTFSALAYTIPYYHLYLRKKISNFIRENDIEAVHIHDIQVARAVFDAGKKFNLPMTLDLHENRPEIMQYYAHLHTLSGKLLISPAVWKKYEQKYITQADHVVVVTEEAKQYYLNRNPALNPEKFHVVPNTIRESFYTNYQFDNAILSRYKNDYTILYLGDTGLRRGLLTVLQSLKFLVPAIPNIKVVIVGTSKEDSVLKNYVKQHHFEKYVDFEGWQDVSLFPSYILASEIGICPIHRNLHHDTTYANKLFQYMSFGKPVVVSDCPAQKRLVEEYACGLAFEDRNEKDFSEKILMLYQDNKVYNAMSKNAKDAIVNDLSWENRNKELLKIYK
jgi:glycosyltransferase involved in cell wall biosynthesis